MGRRGAFWLAGGIWVLSAGLAVLTWLFWSKSHSTPGPSPDLWILTSGGTLLFSSPGALIVAKRPSNPIGWIVCAIGLDFGLLGFANEYGFQAVVANPQSLPGGVLALWIADLLILPIFGLVPLLILLFPDGTLPSRKWRPVIPLILGATLTLMLLSALYPRSLGGVSNPTGIHGAADALDSLTFVILMLLIVAIFISVWQLLFRFWDAQGEERQQLKWFMYGAVILGFTLLGSFPALWAGLIVLPLIGFGLFTTSVGIATLRYRLYDIDRLVYRTLVYGALTATLALVYAGGVAGGGSLLREVTGEEGNNLVVAASTLAVAAMFRPARARIQAFIDRRFYRSKYDAAKALESFSARLRDEVSLDTVSTDLLAIVGETMQPAHASLWLRQRS
jgi:hypothetical protein